MRSGRIARHALEQRTRQFDRSRRMIGRLAQRQPFALKPTIRSTVAFESRPSRGSVFPAATSDGARLAFALRPGAKPGVAEHAIEADNATVARRADARAIRDDDAAGDQIVNRTGLVRRPAAARRSASATTIRSPRRASPGRRHRRDRTGWRARTGRGRRRARRDVEAGIANLARSRATVAGSRSRLPAHVRRQLRCGIDASALSSRACPLRGVSVATQRSATSAGSVGLTR